MKKSPEEYFKEQNFSADAADKSHFSPAEQAFMEKYLGVKDGTVLEKIHLDASKSDQAHAPNQHEAMNSEVDLDSMLRETQDLLMVGFFIGEQEFTLPAVAVQEVIRSITPAKLPAAPDFVAGVVNLRGKITPLIHLRDMLEVVAPRRSEDNFIIVCRRLGFQVGMLIERVHTMYRVRQADIDWGIENHLGINIKYVSGLLKINDQLVGIVSVDRIIAAILK